MSWLSLLLAGVLEVVFSFYMKEAAGFTKLVPSVLTVVAVTGSLTLLSYAMRTLPLGTAYCVWTGIGSVGALAVGMVWFGESASLLRLTSAALVVLGLLGLRFSS